MLRKKIFFGKDLDMMKVAYNVFIFYSFSCLSLFYTQSKIQ